MLKHDTPLPENVEAQERRRHAENGSAAGKDDPASHNQTAEHMTHGQESYPGSRPGGNPNDSSATPPAADTDPGASRSAESTGQVGSRKQPVKETGNPW